MTENNPTPNRYSNDFLVKLIKMEIASLGNYGQKKWTIANNYAPSSLSRLLHGHRGISTKLAKRLGFYKLKDSNGKVTFVRMEQKND